MSAQRRRILGIDPGTNVLGYGLIDVVGNHAEVVVLGVVELKHIADPYQKLGRISERVGLIIDEYKPDELAIEAPFFGKNVQSMLKLGRAQGVCMAAALNRRMTVCEYAPTRIKQSITGHGDAAKEQVAQMLQTMLHFADIPKYLDATDALAAAYCHFLNGRVSSLREQVEGSSNVKIPKSTGRSRDWKSFVNQNPDRVRK